MLSQSPPAGARPPFLLASKSDLARTKSVKLIGLNVKPLSFTESIMSITTSIFSGGEMENPAK